MEEKRVPLPEGTFLISGNSRYRITGKPLGFGGGSLIYPAIKENEKLELIIKEVFPVSDQYHFERDMNTLLVRPKADNLNSEEDAERYLSMIRKTVKDNESQISQIVRNNTFIRVIPLQSLSEVDICCDGQIVGTAYDSFAVMERMGDPDRKNRKAVLLAELREEFRKEPENEYPFRFGGTVPIHISARIIEQVLYALETVHNSDYIHGDIQWNNIYFSECNFKTGNIGQATLIDFGAAQKLKENGFTEQIKRENLLSTEGFRPLEALEFTKGFTQLSAAYDTYAVTYLFFLLCGGEKYISYGEPALQLYEDPDLCRINRKDVGCNRKVEQELNRILTKGLAPNHKDRYADASDMLEEISRFATFAEKESRRKRYTNKGSICPVTSSRSSVLDRTYVRRADLLAKLSQIMSVMEDGKQYAILTAMGGEGKSELARAYAMEHIDSYEDIFWITCRDGEEPELLDLLKNQNCKIEKEDLWELDDLTLMIIDNCNTDSPEFLNQVLERTGKAHVIITTRLPHLMESEENVLPVVSEDREAFAYAVFEKNYTLISRRRKHKTIREEEIPSVREICRLVEYNPMMVAMIAIELREYDNRSIREFAERLQHGLREASLTGAQIKYDKDGKRLKSDISDILRFVFTDLLHHGFTEEEKQVLTLLKLVPAEHIDQDFLCEILGDNENQVLMQTACGNLQDNGWLQGNGEWIAIHPLISEVLELDEKQTLIWYSKRNDFYKHLLENWLVMDFINLFKEKHFIYRIWKFLEIGNITAFDIAVSSLLQTNYSKSSFSTMYSNIPFALVCYVDFESGRNFICFDLIKREEICFLNLEKRKINQRYWYKNTDYFNIMNSKATNITLLYLVLHEDYEEKAILDFPDMICKCYIKEIPDLFCAYSDVEELKLPSNLEKIGDKAFCECYFLNGNLTIPASVITIGNSAFEGCDEFKGDLVIPNSVKEIGNSAFKDCAGFTGNLILPQEITTIKKSTFSGCEGLTGNLVIPNSVEEIGKSAFSDCKKFTGDLVIPNSVKKIGNSAFENCTGFNGNLILSKEVTTIGKSAFSGCRRFTGDLVIPNSVKKIGNSAFMDCKKFHGKLVLSNNITKIKGHTFEDCTGFTGDLTIPHGVTVIGKSAFSNCKNFHGKLMLPDSITRIKDFAFMDCRGFTGDLTIPNNVKTIGEGAFSGCKGFTGELIIPEDNITIKKSAFWGCNNLNGSIVIKDSAETIYNFFDDILESFYSFEIVDTLKTIFDKIYKYCKAFIKKCIVAYVKFNKYSILTKDIIIPENSTKIKNSAFYNYNNIGRLIMPEGIITIGNDAFCFCSNLMGELIIPSSVVTIGDSAFFGCNRFTGNLMIPNNVKIIKNSAFALCSGFTGDLIIPNSVEKIGNSAFESCDGFAGSLIISNNIEIIEDSTFAGCEGFTGNLIIPSNVKSIGNFAFAGCASFTGDLIIPEGVIRIGQDTFSGCFNLSEKLVIPTSVIFIGKNAFQDCNFDKIFIYNINCNFEGSIISGYTPTIYGYKGSTAENYAQENHLPFEYLD